MREKFLAFDYRSSELNVLQSSPQSVAITWKEQLIQSLRRSQQLAENPAETPLAPSWISLSESDRDRVIAAKDCFPFMVPVGYAQLVDWQDPTDPLRQLVLPTVDEENAEGSLDTSGESLSTIVPGLQHKYEQTAVLIVTQACAGHCRYCFRRRLMSRDVMVKEAIEDLQDAIAYIQQHSELDNVLLSGGDPMICSTRRLENLLARLATIPHLWQIRISTKLPAFLPSRFTTDPELLDVLRVYQSRFQIVFQCHFDHPREITPEAERAIAALRHTGCTLTAQIPLMRGVNHHVETLTQLFQHLHRLGVLPQYLFHPRPVKHATHFQLPILEAKPICWI
jgi:KamA family protein